LDDQTLSVLFNSSQVIVGGSFQAGYSGTIIFGVDETTLTVTVSTHPVYPVGINQVNIQVTDLAGLSPPLSFNFDYNPFVAVGETLTLTEASQVVVGIPFPETLTLTEQLDALYVQRVSVSEAISISESLDSGSLLLQIVNGTLRATFPFELHFDGISKNENYQIESNHAIGNPGVPVAIQRVEPLFTVVQTGSAASVLPEPHPDKALGAKPAYDLVNAQSNVLQIDGTTNILSHLGNFISLTSGQNAGLYQILNVLEEGPPSSILVLDKPLSVMGEANGILQLPTTLIGIVNLGGNPLAAGTPDYRYTFRVDDPRVTPSNPLRDTYRVEKQARNGVLGTLSSSTDIVNPASVYTFTEPTFVPAYDFALPEVELVDYRTFRVRDDSATWILGATPDVGGGGGAVTTPLESFRAVVQVASSVDWQHTTGVKGLDIYTSKMTDGGNYCFDAFNLFFKTPKTPYASGLVPFGANGIPRPELTGVSIDDGVIFVTYNEDMQNDDAHLTNEADYSIVGPSAVRIRQVNTVSPRTVALWTSGIVNGNYTLTVSSSTPKDIAGNPLNPSFNSAVFTGSVPLLTRSLFTDKGPIARPPLTLQSGFTATLDDFNKVSLPGAALTLSDIGKQLRLTGSAENDSTYKVLSIVDSNTVKVQASFNLPDANNGAIDWDLIDPRDGLIADDPSDVTVRVNGLAVVPEAVIGLRGQVVLSTTPAPTDDVQIDYGWCCNPTVEIRRLNSKEFRLNGWNRDFGGVNDSAHHYRYNNVLTVPDSYQADEIRAGQAQPLLRQLKYRAYERAYSALLNDPTRLLLNTPLHKVAYPPASRPLTETVVFYEGLTLPENDVTNPWVRKGTGTASIAAGVLTIVDDSNGTFPIGQPIFWTRPLDITFDHVFSAAWRFSLDSIGPSEGVWTGIAAGYSTDIRAYVVGYLNDGGVKKIGFLKSGAEDKLNEVAAWGGGLDVNGDPTGLPVVFDWSILHSYRLFTDPQGVLRLYFDGNVVESLRLSPSEAPFLEELNAPFDEIQGVFFGSLSRPAESTSNWDFYRYLIQPTNSQQISVSSFVSYEASVLPEVDLSPWTPVGYHGHSRIVSPNCLEINSTSASDSATSAAAGLVGGDFRGYVKIEPLLSSASEFSVDVDVQLLSHTHSFDPDGLMVAVDDSTRLLQLCFLSDEEAPLFSYGGRSFPEDFSPYVWSTLGGQTAAMVGRVLKITDSSLVDGKVYYIEDTEPTISDDRVSSVSIDYALEMRLRVESYTLDGSGFAGAFAQNFDGTRSVGLMLLELAGVRYVAFHSEGLDLGVSARFAFDWNDDLFHTYRFRKNTAGDLVTLFVDGLYLGSFPYSSFVAPPPDPIGVLSFGSSTPASTQAHSVVEWQYCNLWRVPASERRYVGLWKGTSEGDLRDYHIPLKASGKQASVIANTLQDLLASFITANIQIGDLLVVDEGANAGTYEVANVTSATVVTLTVAWPAQPTLVNYRIVRQTDWSARHKYRLFRDSSGNVLVFLDLETLPIIKATYNAIDLPPSGSGVIKTLSGGLAAIAFGSLSPENLALSSWDFVRYGITRSPIESRAVPINRVLNQWNVMESPERLFTNVAHTDTGFKSSSVGITPQTYPDFLSNTAVPAWTQLNEGTPLVPLTQNFETRGPFTTLEFVSALNRPEDVLNNDGDFTLNDGSRRYNLVVPDDVLYACLKVTETQEGETQLLRPFDDDCGPQLETVYYQKEACLDYTADTLPETDPTASTPWSLNSDNPSQVSILAAGGILTYGTGGAGTKTVYLNNTPLPDAPSLQTEVTFRLKLLSDSTGGTGDSKVRFGISAPNMTLGLGFVTTALGERLVIVFDINSGSIMGATTFDYLDGAFHDYRIVRTPTSSQVQVFIDS
jgi:hypothetical protein